MSEAIRDVVILGGGSAGWLVAGILAADHGAASGGGLRVTLVESPDVATIGVGEGTWPTMRDTLRRIGVSESDFFRECDASFKQGSKFIGWRDGTAGDQYHHPFVLPQGYLEADLVGAWLQHPAEAFGERVCFQPRLCEAGRAPKQFATPEFAAVANYAYHLDAGKLGAFLRRHCVERLGVRHVSDHVTAIDAADNGDIAGLRTRDHGILAGDLFVDCTGMRAVLLGEHYGIAHESQQHVLFADRAIAVQVPYADPRGPIACQTLSTAQPNGWTWDIGLQSRRGVGHVYSSAHTSDDKAADVLRRHVLATGGAEPDPASMRRIGIRPGYRKQSWHRNCVAIGLSSGFVEPLEASSLVLVELASTMLSDQMPATRATMDLVAARFNDSFAYRWERVVDFLKLHYLLSTREDSDFWRDHRRPESIPPRLQVLLELWRHHPPSRYDLPRVEEIFPSASYQYVLYGMGFRPPPAPAPTARRRVDAIAKADRYSREAADLARRMIAGLPSHRDMIDHAIQHGMPRL
ncbi:tryptophan halogenase family protein [Marilutibacter aestuarii]|uniref:Tryptophan 7-halogenase n=1 Tax=Marilutibacter aestuarii TaxID=1706195 RepID=A0A508A4M9_9GAMM|nr:tryptophan halogenase family protein [Lysobacter aestuarii]TQD44896.1 tryptophan 7-halogenase [Lysobacter aestuarii]